MIVKKNALSAIDYMQLLNCHLANEKDGFTKTVSSIDIVKNGEYH